MSIFGVLRRYVENGAGVSKWVGRDDRNYKSIFGGLPSGFQKALVVWAKQNSATFHLYSSERFEPPTARRPSSYKARRRL